ncbi:hypothetical protein AYI70_g11940 [Smittium culicis]|uniref:Uncharacterized protein n=1 Tax=Smittium culicis TaxID=133412 RepID=A0A1R1WZL5_9FUNG|nr:hypothetical protein AYI70_g11940 [Smittium culicis]
MQFLHHFHNFEEPKTDKTHAQHCCYTTNNKKHRRMVLESVDQVHSEQTRHKRPASKPNRQHRQPDLKYHQTVPLCDDTDSTVFAISSTCFKYVSNINSAS